MINQRRPHRQFLDAPASVPAVVAAVLEPLIAVLCLIAAHSVFGQVLDGPSTVLAMLVLVMMFPGVNRFGRSGIGVGIDIVLSWSGVLCVLLLIALATRGHHHFRRDMLIAWAIATPLLQWAAFALGTRAQRSGWLTHDVPQPVVIVGADRTGIRVAEMLAARRRPGQVLLGLFEDRSPERVALPSGLRLLGRLPDLPAFIDRHGVTDVFITLPLTQQPRILGLVESLQNTTASLHFVPDVFGVTIIQGRLEDMGGVPVVSLLVAPFTGISGVMKRTSDILLASLILLAIAPVMAAVAIGVKRSSPGPMIFRQRRTGLNGEIIEIYKFRSMTTLDDGPVVVQATRGDPRITKFGAFIRRTSLDELPQFVNVLQGRMSIVGPRPHAVAHNHQYRALVKAYMARHKVKPGITGWAQINGFRGETDTLDKMVHRVEYDLEYLRNWSLGLDLLIIARTAKQMLLDRGAY